MNLKSLLISTITIFCLVCLQGCGNQGYSDLTYNKAIIKLPNEEVKEVEVMKWHDYGSGQMTILTKDGTRYFVSGTDCVLIGD